MLQFAGSILVFVFATALAAQVTTGEIRGVVVDLTGSLVPGASVTVHSLDTNADRKVSTDESGTFHVPQLAVGAYEVTVDKTGFSRYIQGPIVVRLNQIADLRIGLQVAGVAAEIKVVADAPPINSANAEVGVNFDSRRVSELPLAPNRSVVNLALSVAGVTQLQGGQNAQLNPEGSVPISVNGMRIRSTNFMVDGQDSNFHVLTGLAQRINNPDVIAEFRVITNQFAAEYGRAAGGVVNMITRSGTNRLHGSAFIFHNDNHLNSRSNLDKKLVRSAPFRLENQIGGTLGGPIVPDKTFFFGSLQRWTDRRFLIGPNIRGVPTAEGLSLLNSIAGDRPTVKALLEHLPAAQSAVQGLTAPLTVGPQQFSIPLGTLSGSNKERFNDWQWSARFDHKLNAAHNLGGRYLFDDSIDSDFGQITPPDLSAVLRQRRHAATVFLNSALSHSAFHELRLSYQRLGTQAASSNPGAETIPSIEINELGLSGFMDGAVRSGIGMAVSIPRGSRNNTYQVQDTFGLVRGSHVMKFGADLRREETIQLNTNLSRGRLVYATLQDFVDDRANLGRINSPLPGGTSLYLTRYYDYAFFAQDEWRVRPRLAFTYGVRYESPGSLLTTVAGLNRKIVAAAGGDSRYVFGPIPPRDRNNWAPRFGFNYRVTAQTVIRGGYARTYDQFFEQLIVHALTAFPFVKSDSLAARTPNSLPILRQLPSSPIVNPDMLDRGVVSEDLRAPVAEQFSLQLQRELAKDWSVSIGYVGTKGTALFETVDGNPVVPGSNPRRRVDPARGVVTVRCNCTSSIYHSLQTSLEKRLSQNFSMAAHYTWSSFIDGASDVVNPSPTGEIGIAQDAFNRRAERGRSAFDRPHRFVFNGVFELPFYTARTGASARVLGGWQLSTFLTLQSGAPFSALSGADPGGRVTPLGSTVRANLNTTLDVSRMSIEELLRAGGRQLFAPATASNPIGNMGRNVLRSSPYRNIDVGIIKNTRFSESQNLQIRAEFYNLTNSRNFGMPDGNMTSANFLNQWGTDGGNRRVVMGLRYIF